MLKKTFGKHFTVFYGFEDTADNFIKLFSLHRAGPVQNKFFFFYHFSFVCLFVCLFLCLYDGHDGTITAMFLFQCFVCMYMHYLRSCVLTFLL